MQHVDEVGLACLSALGIKRQFEGPRNMELQHQPMVTTRSQKHFVLKAFLVAVVNGFAGRP